MYYSSAIKGRAVAGLCLISISFSHTVLAATPQLPASLQSDEALLAPPYIPVVAPQSAAPAVSNWAEVNQRVHEIGGWMFYASEGAMDHEHHKQPKQPEPTTNSHEGH